MLNFRPFLTGSAMVAMTCGLAFPVAAETLHYSINWQSGLSLGEATLSSEGFGGGSGPNLSAHWNFALNLDAAVPGLTIRDEYRSNSDGKFCSSNLDKTVTRGARKTSEKVTFDQGDKKVTRETNAGGKSSYEVPDCARDALSFIQFIRQELAQGRLPASQPVILGAKYDVQLTYTGVESIARGEKHVDADRVHVIAKGPKSDVAMDLFFAKDDVRTPLLARVPLSLGTFAIELIP